MSMNFFFEVVDPQELNKCIEEGGNVNKFLYENTLMSVDTEFFGNQLAEAMEIDENIGKLGLARDIDCGEDGPMGMAGYDSDAMQQVIASLDDANIKKGVENYANSDGGSGSDNDWLIRIIQDIVELFKVAQKNDKKVVFYVG